MSKHHECPSEGPTMNWRAGGAGSITVSGHIQTAKFAVLNSGLVRIARWRFANSGGGPMK